MAQQYWLKMVGAADWPLADRWVEERPELLRGVRTPRKPSGIKASDLLIYYSAGTQKLFGIVRSTMPGEEAVMEAAAGEARWPYLLSVQALLVIPTLALAPHWEVLGLPSSTVQQKSYIELSRAQYRLGWEAIVARTGL